MSTGTCNVLRATKESGQSAVAMFVLFTASARARVVAADARDGSFSDGSSGYLTRRALVEHRLDLAGLSRCAVGDVGDALGPVFQVVGGLLQLLAGLH